MAAKADVARLEKDLAEKRKRMKFIRGLNEKYQVRVIRAVETHMKSFPETESDKPSARPSAQSAHQPTSPESPILARRPTAVRSGSSRAAATPAPQVELFPEAGEGQNEEERAATLNIRPDVLESIRAQRSTSLMVKNMAVAIWGTDGLKDRSVTGSASNRCHGDDPKRRLTPKKLDAIRAELGNQMKRRGSGDDEVAQAIKKVPRYINEKIQDVRRKIKKNTGAGDMSTTE